MLLHQREGIRATTRSKKLTYCTGLWFTISIASVGMQSHINAVMRRLGGMVVTCLEFASRIGFDRKVSCLTYFYLTRFPTAKVSFKLDLKLVRDILAALCLFSHILVSPLPSLPPYLSYPPSPPSAAAIITAVRGSGFSSPLSTVPARRRPGLLNRRGDKEVSLDSAEEAERFVVWGCKVSLMNLQ